MQEARVCRSGGAGVQVGADADLIIVRVDCFVERA